MTTRGPVPSIAVLALCACVPVTEQETGTRLVGGASAFAVPAAGGPAVIAVVERRYSNAVEQSIALDTRAVTRGQNSLGVRVLGLARTKGDDALVPTVMTDDAIVEEMRAAFPGVRMSVSPAFVQNAYGPFGYAVGRGAGRDLCLYGWQRIGGEVTTPFVRQGAIETRLRICQAGADERTLLAGMYGYTVQASFGPGWSTGSSAPALPAAIGAAGVPIYPVAVQMAPAALPEQAREPVQTRQTRPAPPQQVVVEAAAPATVSTLPGPTVPPPGGAAVPPPAVASPVVPTPLVRSPVLSADASLLPAMAAAVSRTPHVPSPPVRVVVPGVSEGAKP